MSTSENAAQLAIPHEGRYDLRSLFRAVGPYSAQRALTTTPAERPEPETPAVLLDDRCVQVSAEPLEVGAFVDGVQAALSVTYRDHRPVHLVYVAAGAVDTDHRPVGLREQLYISCSVLDAEWVYDLGTDIPVETITESSPIEVERAALTTLGAKREHLERELTRSLVDLEHTPVVVDGSLSGRDPEHPLLGIIKTTRRRYLADESVLFGLRAGWRTPRFFLPAGTAGATVDRYSTYLRLTSAEHAAFDFGLLRLEAFDPDELDALAARCLAERQGAASGDVRWDRHIKGIARCEEFMRARRPWVFGR